MNQKGQLSFEMLLITLVIFSLAIVVAGYHFMEQDTTSAMLIAKSETLSWLAEKDEFYYINEVNFDTGTNTLTIDLSANNFTPSEIDNLKKIVTESVEKSTNLSGFEVKVNE